MSNLKIVINKTEEYSGIFPEARIDSLEIPAAYEPGTIKVYDIDSSYMTRKLLEMLEEAEVNISAPQHSGYYVLLYESDNASELNSKRRVEDYGQEENICQEIVEVRNAPTDDRIVTVLHNGLQFNVSSYRQNDHVVYIPLPQEVFTSKP